MHRDVRDIDLVSGGLSEHPLPGAIVGPTFACLVADEFKALKFGDRFYYEHGDQAGSFTPGEFRFTPCVAEVSAWIILGKVSE